MAPQRSGLALGLLLLLRAPVYCGGWESAISVFDAEGATADKNVHPLFLPDGSFNLTDPAMRRRLTTAQLTYHGGAVLHNTVNLYYIWYGSWTLNSGMPILQV